MCFNDQSFHALVSGFNPGCSTSIAKRFWVFIHSFKIFHVIQSQASNMCFSHQSFHAPVSGFNTRCKQTLKWGFLCDPSCIFFQISCLRTFPHLLSTIIFVCWCNWSTACVRCGCHWLDHCSCPWCVQNLYFFFSFFLLIFYQCLFPFTETLQRGITDSKAITGFFATAHSTIPYDSTALARFFATTFRVQDSLWQHSGYCMAIRRMQQHSR